MRRERIKFQQWWYNRSVSTVIVVSFGTLFAIITTVFALLFTVSVRRTLIKSVYDTNLKLVDEAVTNIDSLNDLVTSISFYIAGDAQLRQLLRQFPENPVDQIPYKNSIKSYLTQLWMNRPEIVGISIYLDNAKEINTGTIGVSSLAFLEQNGWREQLGNNRGIIINSPKSIVRGNVVFNSLSLVRILDETNETIGYISLEIAAKHVYSQCMERSLASPNSIMFALDEHSVVVIHPDSSLIGTHAASAFPQFGTTSDKNPPLIRNGKKPYILIYSRPSKSRLQVVEMIPLEDVFHFTPVLITFGVLTLLAIVLSSVLIFIITKKLTKPIITLSSAMSSDKPLEMVSIPDEMQNMHNEIKKLYRSYHDMTQHITELIEQLRLSMENQKRLEINALRAQINPHFMYNCLDYINWKAQDEQVPEISRMLTNLSRFMRISLSDSDLTCPLKAEIDHVRTYLEIFQARYDRSFDYDISAEYSLYNIQIPQFILQPLVENSIMHGFGKHVSGGRINICITQRNDWLCFDVIDNGKGMSEEEFTAALTSTVPSAKSGLKNINDRIRSTVTTEAFSGLTKIASSQGLHIHFEIRINRK